VKKQGIKYWDKKLIGTGGVLNEYVKWRDAIRIADGKPVAICITCKRECSSHNLHAGHWISRRWKGSAYDVRNLHAQCGGCNHWGNGEPQMYEDELRDLYGDDVVSEIRSWVGKTRKWKPFELEEMYHHYRGELDKLKKKYLQ